MSLEAQWRLFNVDSFAEESPGDWGAATIDLSVAALAFKNFDFVAKRLPFLVECSTRDPFTWLQLVDLAAERYWIREAVEGVAVYAATDHCGCIRTYRFNVNHAMRAQQWGRKWISLPNEQALYTKLDTPASRAIFDSWHQWQSKVTELATTRAEGRFNNTVVNQSLIFSSTGRGCTACAAPAVAHASTTVVLISGEATLIQVPFCGDHFAAARAEPCFLTFLARLFAMSIDLPTLIRSESIPDEVVPVIHQIVATELGGTAGSVEKRSNGWHILIDLADGWYWIIRVKALMDYAYMLFNPSDKKAVYRADSAPHHPNLPFFPDHEHSRPDRKSDVQSPSFLYGMPLFDLKRLRDVSDQYRADFNSGL
jgi:Family of unknown function (DUF6516)